MPAEFTHLHLHTDYSLLDGACDVDKLVKHVKALGQTSVAMTDHGNIYGAVHFFNAAKEAEIKALAGQGVGLSEIARRLDIGKASVHRVLNT